MRNRTIFSETVSPWCHCAYARLGSGVIWLKINCYKFRNFHTGFRMEILGSQDEADIKICFRYIFFCNFDMSIKIWNFYDHFTTALTLKTLTTIVSMFNRCVNNAIFWLGWQSLENDINVSSINMNEKNMFQQNVTTLFLSYHKTVFVT
jgi:hypothetical protein